MVLGLTPMQMRFAKVHARTGDETYAAWHAGYRDPVTSGKQLKKNPMVQETRRVLAQKYLLEEAGTVAVKTLAELTGPDKVDGIRLKAASELAKLANIAITDAAAEKLPTEMTAGELGHMVAQVRQQLEQQQAIARRALASLPRAIIEHEHDSIFD